MTFERNYRKEAQSARRAARETLMALREARLSARAQRGSPPNTAPSQAGSDGSQIDPSAFFAMPPNAPDVTPDMAKNTEEAWAAGAAEDAVAEQNVGEETEICATPEEQPAESALELDETVGAAYEPSDCPTDSDTPDAGEPMQVSVDQGTDDGIARVDANSDLFNLPGAGAGMVWMVHQCGIRSLADLAKADSGDLAMQLGVVGHIINMEPWIAFAREGEQGMTG